MIIGFSGHRPNRIGLPYAIISAHLAEVFARLKTEQQNKCKQDGQAQNLEAMASLAEGSDRLFAQAAMAANIPFTAMLPFGVEAYENTFEDESENVTYHRLLSLADKVTILDGVPQQSSLAYQVMGHYIASHCDVLIAVWDGNPAQGKGGTPEVIDFGKEQGKPVIWVHATEDIAAQY